MNLTSSALWHRTNHCVSHHLEQKETPIPILKPLPNSFLQLLPSSASAHYLQERNPGPLGARAAPLLLPAEDPQQDIVYILFHVALWWQERNKGRIIENGETGEGEALRYGGMLFANDELSLEQCLTSWMFPNLFQENNDVYFSGLLSGL